MISSLESSTIEAIRSGITISSLNHALVELIQNSIDASATRIQILIHHPTLQVTDNGVGFDPLELKSLLGKRYGILVFFNQSNL